MKHCKPVALVVTLLALAPAAAALPPADFLVDTDVGTSAFSHAQCFQGTLEGAPGGTPLTLADALFDDGAPALEKDIPARCRETRRPGEACSCRLQSNPNQHAVTSRNGFRVSDARPGKSNNGAGR